ncbi:VOC family protein [Brooklawnia sp.]|uniref:VOC family protein n=1 Tax=Brooklawnia sp. TaxID=2699740 RepID=UPI00311E33F0
MLNASPYIVFSGQAREALEFYQSILGGELNIAPQSQYNPDPAVADLVMHGQLDVPGFSLMAGDDPSGNTATGSGKVTITLWGDDFDDARRIFDALSQGGTVGMAFGKQMWGDYYGDVTDKYGVAWAVDVTVPAET